MSVYRPKVSPVALGPAPQRKSRLDTQGVEKRQEILEWLDQFIAQKGYSPSVREIGEAVGLRSSSTIQHHLKRLEQEGKVIQEKRAGIRFWSVAGKMRNWQTKLPGEKDSCIANRRYATAEEAVLQEVEICLFNGSKLVRTVLVRPEGQTEWTAYRISLVAHKVAP